MSDKCSYHGALDVQAVENHKRVSQRRITEYVKSGDADHCVLCSEKFQRGITIWRLREGWSHPECARKEGRKLEDEKYEPENRVVQVSPNKRCKSHKKDAAAESQG